MTLKRIHKTPHSCMHRIIMEVPEFMEVIVTGIMTKTIARTTYNSSKTNLESVGKPVNLFVEEV